MRKIGDDYLWLIRWQRQHGNVKVFTEMRTVWIEGRILSIKWQCLRTERNDIPSRARNARTSSLCSVFLTVYLAILSGVHVMCSRTFACEPLLQFSLHLHRKWIIDLCSRTEYHFYRVEFSGTHGKLLIFSRFVIANSKPTKCAHPNMFHFSSTFIQARTRTFSASHVSD